MKSFTATIFYMSLVASTAAHGWIGSLTVGSKSFKGNEPVEQTPNGVPSVIRQIANNLPVKDTTSSDLTCGRSALPAALVATASAGDTLLVDWNTLAASGNWFHDVGPMITYMAGCGAQKCTEFNASDAKWFKIDQQGQEADGTWAQAKLAGSYLLRHEIIALHTAQSKGGAEFYTSCSQMSVTGSGTGAPQANELVSLPGAYTATDPGILIDVYNMNGAPYQFPGPPVASFVNSAFSSSSPQPPASPPTPATPAKTAAAPSKCKHKHKHTSRVAPVPADEKKEEQQRSIPNTRRPRSRHLRRFETRSF
ncbi:glycosyl hydrolase family 61-domain-containing protein [Mycena galopus ATCC 62051]|nr:glycosyl hydrolase family 61-domain-containing protein [Mycena galopus ATCC 62051]